MANYRILLAGKNDRLIDDFFYKLMDEFRSVTTSLRFPDMKYHVNNVNPDIFVLCSDGETDDEIRDIQKIKDFLDEIGTYIVVVGSHDDCEHFVSCAPGMAHLTVEGPASAEDMGRAITDFMAAQKSDKEEVNYQEEAPALSAPWLNMPKKHVLVVDDDTMILKMVKEMLHDKYDVAIAPSGKVARNFLESKTTDLILLDFEMPVENGPEVYKSIRKMDRYKNTPILFLTGVSDKDKIREALVLKPQGYILKPIDRELLLNNIEGLLK